MKALGASRPSRLLASGRPAVRAPARRGNSLGAWRLTRRLANHGKLAILRAAAADDRGPGCYVLKTPARAEPQDEFARALLHHEATVAADLNQANLVTVIGASFRSPRPYVVLPYLEGVTLRRLLAATGPLPVASALGIIRQISSALAAMHAAGWLHGQVRPDHVIVSPQGHATLIDLTQARRLESSECDLDGTFPASPTCAAPEMFARGRMTSAVDTYAIGVTLFETLIGQPPFAEPTPRHLAAAHRQKAPPGIRDLRLDVSPDVAELLRRMLAKEPLRRPSDEQLVRWLAELEIEELSL